MDGGPKKSMWNGDGFGRPASREKTMAEVKGKFITLTGRLMSSYKEALGHADGILLEKTGMQHDKLDPEGWYDTAIFNTFMEDYAKASVAGQEALLILGKRVYPTIRKTTGLPPEIQTPLEMILFEAKGFELNHRGNGVLPRKFIKKDDRHVIVQAPAPGYSQKLFEGVYLGILEMFDVKTGKVVYKGDATHEYEITW